MEYDEEQLDILQKLLEESMFKVFENMGEEVKYLSFFASNDNEESLKI